MKRNLFLLIACLMLTVSANAQIFLMGESSNKRDGEFTLNFDDLQTPGFDDDHDNHGYVPIGSGASLLIGFGAAYLMAKKKKKLFVLAACLMFAVSANAQVFQMGNESSERDGTESFDINALQTPGNFNDDHDNHGYVPIGSGASLLIGFGAAYMMAKKRKE